MRKYLLTGAAAFCLIGLPSVIQAQGTMGAPPPTAEPPAAEMPAPPPPGAPPEPPPPARPMTPASMTPDQKAQYDAWPAEQKADYDSWTPEYQAYYWSLSAPQQKGYWALTPDQRGQIYKMTPEQQAIAWNSIAQQMAGKTPTTPPTQANPPGEGMPTTGVPDPQSADQAVRPAMPADQTYQGGPYKGAMTPPPATAMNKDYPVCSKTVKDNCRNRGGK
jgi:hypothetical protein